EVTQSLYREIYNAEYFPGLHPAALFVNGVMPARKLLRLLIHSAVAGQLNGSWEVIRLVS
ncbi:hypothetical protein, partial [Chitinophaga sp.]|uniref:hypothetical protein n=1 Tax=Chitinophaga sp. TaxID=1869181 RepID=UPI0031D0EA41